MFSLAELTFDDDFCTEFIVVKRSDPVWNRGVQTAGERRISVTGVVFPASAKDLELVEEGDRRHGLKTFLTGIRNIWIIRRKAKISAINSS